MIGDHSDDRRNHFNLIRMVAAAGVLVSHAYPLSLGPQAEQPLSALIGMSLGEVGVYIFFGISGFFIAKSFVFGSCWRRFIAARVLRLFPALVVVLLVTIGVSGLLLSTASPARFWVEAPTYFIRNVTLYFPKYDLVDVFAENPYGPAINGSLWTLSYEVTCYAGVFIAGMLGLFRAPRAFLLSFALVLCLIFAAPYLPVSPRLRTLARLATPFAFGVGFFVWRDRIPLSPWIAAALCGLAVLAHGGPVFRPMFVLALCYTTFVIGYARAPLLLQYNRLGDYSYGLYIYAFPIQQIVAGAGVDKPLLNMMIAAPATLACAVLSWVLIERVALRYKPGRRRAIPVARSGGLQ